MSNDSYREGKIKYMPSNRLPSEQKNTVQISVHSLRVVQIYMSSAATEMDCPKLPASGLQNFRSLHLMQYVISHVLHVICALSLKILPFLVGSTS